MSMDFPRAWQICRATPVDQHHERCSYRTGMLCDCQVITQHPEYLDDVLQGLDGIPCAKKPVRVLHLHLKFEYFDQIKSGQKPREYRLVSKWKKRLEGKAFDEIHLYRGYPKRGSAGMTLYRRWNGMEIERRQHPHFGKKPVEVYAIDVTVPA